MRLAYQGLHTAVSTVRMAHMGPHGGLGLPESNLCGSICRLAGPKSQKSQKGDSLLSLFWLLDAAGVPRLAYCGIYGPHGPHGDLGLPEQPVWQHNYAAVLYQTWYLRKNRRSNTFHPYGTPRLYRLWRLSPEKPFFVRSWGSNSNPGVTQFRCHSNKIKLNSDTILCCESVLCAWNHLSCLNRTLF